MRTDSDLKKRRGTVQQRDLERRVRALAWSFTFCFEKGAEGEEILGGIEVSVPSSSVLEGTELQRKVGESAVKVRRRK